MGQKAHRHQMARFIARGVQRVLQHVAIDHHAKLILKMRGHRPQNQRKRQNRAQKARQGKERDAERDGRIGQHSRHRHQTGIA